MARLKQQCPHCPGGFGIKHILYETENFLIVCDVHPLAEGHILIIPKAHMSCMGALDDGLFVEYKELYQKVFSFLQKAYGKTAAFEHGIAGQTVFHAHAHFLPFKGSIEDIIPEKDALRRIAKLDDIQKEFAKSGKYMFVALNKDMWLVDVRIGSPAFFRERFAHALCNAERGNWKKAQGNKNLAKEFDKDIRSLHVKYR